MLTSLSRITDYKHHPTDVLSGLAIGTMVAIGIVGWTIITKLRKDYKN